MTVSRNLNRCGGFTIVETLGYAVLLIVIMNLSASILIGTRRLHTLGALAIERNEALEEIANDFREVVHGATRIVDSVKGLPESPGNLVLISEASGSVPRYSVWRRDADGRLYLDEYEIGPKRKPGLVSRKVYPAALKVMEYSITCESDRLLKLDLVVDNEATLRTVPKSNRFIAALRQP